MRWLRLTLAYDGTEYAGWQAQSQQRTIQEVLEQALWKLTGKQVQTTASGRTDAGVHALGQAVSFCTDTQLSVDVVRRALNAYLPEDMAVLEVREAPPAFDACRDAVGKLYRYRIHNGPVRKVFDRRYVWHINKSLDAQAMHRSAQALVGTHDFRSYEGAGSRRASTVRTVHRIDVERVESEEIEVEVEGDGFLYRMVRTIVGTLVEVGRGVRPESWPAEVLEAKDRRRAGPTAPPQGLVLVRVDFASGVPNEGEADQPCG